MVQGFALDDDRFMKGKKIDQEYFKRLLERNNLMYMKDWQDEVETSLKLFHYDILEGKGKITKKDAEDKAEREYEKYKIIQDKQYISDFDKLILDSRKIDNVVKN